MIARVDGSANEKRGRSRIGRLIWGFSLPRSTDAELAGSDTLWGPTSGRKRLDAGEWRFYSVHSAVLRDESEAAVQSREHTRENRGYAEGRERRQEEEEEKDEGGLLLCSFIPPAP